MATDGVDFDTVQIRRQADGAAKRLKQHAEGILLDQQQTLKDRILSRAPQGPTGRLRQNVYVEVVWSSKGPILKGGVAGLSYPVFVEFGTSDTAAEPFLRPAFAEMPGYIRRRRTGRR